MTKVNAEIRAAEVRVVDKETKELKKMSLNEALKLAEQTNEDVIMLDWGNGVPVVKIESYDKYSYREQKKKKEQLKKQKANTHVTKEIQMSYSIGEHDLEIKAKNVDRILSKGDKVKVSIIYKGRAATMMDKGFELMKSLEDKLTNSYKIENSCKIEGNRVVMTIVPAR